MNRAFRVLNPLLAAALLAACAGGDAAELATPYDGDYPVSDLDALLEGVPNPGTLPNDNKADTVYPARYDVPRQYDSPVKSQGSRGVCSIFSTVGLMEHLYNKEDSLAAPDFSEQYLQWSVKFQVGTFPTSSGSNAYYNLRAINEFGIVREADAPYERSQWDSSDDEACDGTDGQPTRCYTNGEPSEAAQAARKFRLPRGRWVNPNSIKAHMIAEQTGVIVGFTFFYQSWNHRTSELPINAAYWREGYVTYPNEADEQASLERRAGHSVLLVGWDDDLEVQKRDGEGKLLVDADGNPVMEKGFYLFKNSWGTSSFGVNNEYGAGYGWISMDYVARHGTANVSSVPTIVRLIESCGNGTDDDEDGAADCDDSDCREELSCQPDVQSFGFSAEPMLAIPDNDPAGVASEIEVAETGTIGSATLTVGIRHSYRGDLRVVLYRGDQSIVLHDRRGGGQDDLAASFELPALAGADMAGTWRLVVSDTASSDVGTLDRWSLDILAR